VTVTGAGWTTDQWRGYSIHKSNCIPADESQPCGLLIFYNTADTITYSYVNTGVHLDFSAGQQFTINKISHVLDAPCRSGGTLLSSRFSSSITSQGTTATVTLSNHGFSTGDYVAIWDAIPSAYKGTYQITVAGPNTFTYTMGSSPGVAATFATITKVPAGWNNQVTDPCYQWLNTLDGSNAVFGTAPYNLQIRANEHYYDYTPAFSGTSGMGSGTLAARPSTCTTGVGYWATDQGSWNANGADGVLYKCTSTNSWSLYYTPYAYPHPMVSGSPPPPPSPPTPPPTPPTPPPTPPTPPPTPPTPPPQSPPDTTPPVISSVSTLAITQNSANINWTTDEASDSQIDYGTSMSYGQQTTLNASLTTSHSQSLSNLVSNTIYHYRVRSRDLAGNLTVSSNYSFTTLSPGQTPPPPTPPPPTPEPLPTPPPPTPTPTPTPPTPPGQTPVVKLKLINYNGTYYLIIDNIRHGITNPGLLTSYGFTFEMGRIATAQDMALPEGDLLLPSDGILAKTAQDKTVWLISNSQRLGFTSETVFSTLGFKFSQVLVITDPELNKLPRGANLDNPQARHPDGVDINLLGTIYWVHQGQLYPYPSLEVYNSWRVPNDFSRVLPANTADQALPQSTYIQIRVLE